MLLFVTLMVHPNRAVKNNYCCALCSIKNPALSQNTEASSSPVYAKVSTINLRCHVAMCCRLVKVYSECLCVSKPLSITSSYPIPADQSVLIFQFN